MLLVVKAIPIGNIKLDLESILNKDDDFEADTRCSENIKITSKEINGRSITSTIDGEIVVVLFKSSFSS
ncbi:hypothetical protein C1638_010000 [Chryseobacterium oncorhynchi]|uniref:Uncharacterized protein n=1 Tax=Chryseobacterium oncorhynchi TaxID=741074 RepID=A0A316WZ29_9FLAO|nr:hypothetical protein C1638_010000 [Chryseobacterium oncorhynchi]